MTDREKAKALLIERLTYFQRLIKPKPPEPEQKAS